MTHKLIINGDGPGWEITHPDGCWYVVNGDGSDPEWQYYRDTDCAITREIEGEGFPEDLAKLPTGEYEIEHWYETRRNAWGDLEVIDSGIRLVITVALS